MLFTLLLLTIQTLPGQPERFGLPGCEAQGQELAERTVFVVCHDGTRKVAAWTAHELRAERLAPAPTARPKRFRRDSQLTQAGATDTDYRNSGYHRGHLVPAAEVAWSEAGLRDSFLLSNATPQLPEVNLGAWRRVENGIRKMARESEAVYVVTGTLFDCDAAPRIGAGQVAVPCATYKVALAVRGKQRLVHAVIVANRAGATEESVTVCDVERRTGLRFFPTAGGSPCVVS